MDKHIYIKRKALSKDQCKGIIDFFERSGPQKNPRGYFGVYTNFNTISTIVIKHILSENIKQYTNKHNFLNIQPFEWGVSINSSGNAFHIQKYLPGMAYIEEHMEHGKDEHDCRRILAWMFYLNDIKHKGGTCWPQQNFISKPREGDLYIWPAGWTHSHHGIVAPKEIKYIVTGWYSLNP